MDLKELPSPIRIYWDLEENPSDITVLQKITEEIIESRILFLSLRDLSIPLSRSCLDILSALKDEHIAVSLTVPGPAISPEIRSRLSGSGLKTLLLESSSLREAGSLIDKIEQQREADIASGISFTINKDNSKDLAEVVSLCLDSGIPYLVFPIQRLEVGGNCFCLGDEEGKELAMKLKYLDYSTIQITIHDPFVWKVFYPDADYHEGGCQAANSMLYISPAYKVYPCPAMPIELGDLHETTLAEIIRSPEKIELRQLLIRPAEDCLECDEAENCLGGCRGRALSSVGSLDLRDPGCL
jgi:GeoRSP system SPASM domain protein